MYAVIEFLNGEDRECALVPVLWLVENNTERYWPRTKTEDHFLKLVKSKSAYDKTWPKFPVHKVLHTGEDLHDAEAIMTRFVQLGTSDDSGMIYNITKKSTVLAQQNAIENAEENITADTVQSDVQSEPPKRIKRKHKTEKGGKKKSKTRHTSHIKKGKKKRRHVSSSSSHETSSADENSPPSEVDESISGKNRDNPHINLTERSSRVETTNKIRSVNSIVTCQSNNSTYSNSGNRSPVNATPTRNSINTFIPPSETRYDLSKSFLRSDSEASTSISFRKPNTLEERTLQCLEHIKTYVDQNHVLLRKIFSKQKETNVEITKKPDEFPKLPLNTMENFSKLEDLLRSEEHRTYLIQKLASIGGTNGRQCVLAIMKSLLTNELAMQFNWAGRDKIPFQKTLTMEIIYGAAKQIFLGKKEINDVTENSVSSAVKD